MIKTFKVIQSGKGYAVQLMLNLGSDEMIEVLQHFALFAGRLDAERLAARMRAAGKFDPAHWIWEPSRCTPLAFMQDRPTAVPEKTPRPVRVIDGALLATVETPETWQQRREANRATLRAPAEPKLCKCGTRCPIPQMVECGSDLCAGR